MWDYVYPRRLLLSLSTVHTVLPTSLGFPHEALPDLLGQIWEDLSSSTHFTLHPRNLHPHCICYQVPGFCLTA